MSTDVTDLTVSDLTRLLVDASDKETTEFNLLFDQLESANQMIEKLQKDIVEYKEIESRFNILNQQCETVYKNGEQHLNAAKQAYRERDQAQDKASTANELLKAYKAIDTPKKIREKYKNYQAKILSSASDINAVKEQLKESRKQSTKLANIIETMQVIEAQNSMSSVWSSDGDNLMMFPAKLTMRIGNTEEKQLTLLYMTSSGCGKLIAINDEGDPVECILPKDGLNPKPRTLEVAGEILRKWRRNGWKLDLNDLDLGDM